MPFPVKTEPAFGGVRRFESADDLQIDDIVRRAGSGNMTIGSNLGTDELSLGSATGDVRVLGDLFVDGSETVSTDETITGTFNADGAVNLGDNSGDAIALGGGTVDTVNLNSDLVVGAGTLTIGSSITDYLDDLWLDAVNTNGPSLAAYGLNVSGTNAGAYAIGVDASLLGNSTNTDLMTVLDDLDAAITGGAASLQASYAVGNTIDVTAANGIIDFENSTNADTTTVLLINRSPGASTGGIGLDVLMGANTTGVGMNIAGAGSGDVVFINNTGTGAAFTVQDGGGDVFDIDATGAVVITPTSGQNYTLTVAGAGVIDINGAAAIDIDSTGGGISFDGAGASNFSTSAGNLTFDSAAGELVFDDVGGSGATLSQSSDRTFDLVAAGEVLNGATSVLGAVNRLARAMSDSGLFQGELSIENTVTISAGDVVAASTVSGRVTQNNDNQETRSAIIGIAQTGGTGDAGGTVLCRFYLPGALVTDSGASFTPGVALFAPDGTGRATNAAGAPSNDGDRVTRIGYALTATSYLFQPTEGFVN